MLCLEIGKLVLVMKGVAFRQWGQTVHRFADGLMDQSLNHHRLLEIALEDAVAPLSYRQSLLNRLDSAAI